MAHHIDCIPSYLDLLPFGLLMMNNEQVVYANHFFQHQIGATASDFMDFCQRRPALMPQLRAMPRCATAVQIGEAGFYLALCPLDRSRYTLLLYPDQFAACFASDLAQLRQSCKDYEEIFHQSFDGIFVTDGTGHALMINAGSERNYDIRSDQTIGKHVSQFERSGWIRPVIATRVIAERKRITAIQETQAGKTILATGIPLFDEVGNVRKVIINSRDTTELMQLQEELARAQEKMHRVERELMALREAHVALPGLILHSPAMQKIAGLALRVAKVATTVLITGASGTGKEVLARLIHQHSQRSSGPFIKINCGAIPRDLVESELFGYESGAFTGALKNGKVGRIELADQGTLFLDEIGELSLDAQVKLLQVLQDHVLVRVGGARAIPVDLRVVAATNRDLHRMVDEKTFRMDLFYRLNVVPIQVPSLMQRQEDIIPLIYHYLTEFNQQYRSQKKISARALCMLQEYEWPGNVRELRNLIERLVVTIEQDLIGANDLPEVPAITVAEGRDYRSRVARFEATLVQAAVKQYGSTRAAARHLCISQSSVVRKLQCNDAPLNALSPDDMPSYEP
jgi:PAS domain S-box-containing protein